MVVPIALAATTVRIEAFFSPLPVVESENICRLCMYSLCSARWCVIDQQAVD
jgi:hypothetical protein